MARLFGIEIPNEKRVEASLCYIYGIGPSTAKKVLEQALEKFKPLLNAKG